MADDPQALELSLGDEEAVEGIAVVARQLSYPLSVREGHRKFSEPRHLGAGTKTLGQFQPSEERLDRCLPSRGCADADFGRLRNGLLDSRGQSLTVPLPPEEHVRIEQ